MHCGHAVLSFAPPLCELQQSSSQVRQIFTARVAVAYVNEITLHSPCARVYRQGTYSRVVDLL